MQGGYFYLKNVQSTCHSSMLSVSARRMGSILALDSNFSASGAAMCKPEESELRRVFRFWRNPALISLKKVLSNSVWILGDG